MTVNAVGAEADTFELVSGNSYSHTQTLGRFDDALSRGAMVVTNAVSEIYLPFVDLDTAWIHMRVYQEAVDVGSSYISLRNAAGTETEYRLNIDATGFITVERFKSATFTALATSSAAVFAPDTLADIDIFFNRSVGAGVFQIYLNGVLLLNFSGDTDTTSQIGMIRFEGLTANTREMNVSQVIVADESTIGWKLASLAPNGNGAQTAWTNDVTAIDEFIYNAADFIETNAPATTETFTLEDIDVSFATYNVKAVAVGVRASNDSGSNVAGIQAIARSGGIDFPSTNLGITKDGSEQTKQAIWENDPSTLLPWTQTAVNALEAGVKSV